MLPHANYERVPVHSSPVFGSMLVKNTSNTPYSDATQVRENDPVCEIVDLVSGRVCVWMRVWVRRAKMCEAHVRFLYMVWKYIPRCNSCLAYLYCVCVCLLNRQVARFQLNCNILSELHYFRFSALSYCHVFYSDGNGIEMSLSYVK